MTLTDVAKRTHVASRCGLVQTAQSACLRVPVPVVLCIGNVRDRREELPHFVEVPHGDGKKLFSAGHDALFQRGERVHTCDAGSRAITRSGNLFDQTSPVIDTRMASQLR
jgi:hypothetical protein